MNRAPSLTVPESARQMPRWVIFLNSRAGFRCLFALFVAIVLVFSVVPLVNHFAGRGAKDYALWYNTGQLIVHGQEIYPPRHHTFPFMYPPFAAAMLAPVSLLGQAGLIGALVLVNCAAWSVSIVLSVRLATGQTGRQHALLYLIPNLVIVVYAWSNFLLGQPSLVLLAIMLGGFFCLEQKRNWWAGLLFALAAAIKAFPVLAIIYLIYRRYWIAAASMLVSLVLLLLVLPTSFRGFEQSWRDLTKWTDGMLLKYDEEGVAQRPGRSVTWKNQSIFGVANRLLRKADINEPKKPHIPKPGDSPELLEREAHQPPHVAIYVNFLDLPFKTVNLVILASTLCLGLFYVLVMPPSSLRSPTSDAIEWALLIILILIFAPLSFGYLYAWLLYPFVVVTQRLLIAPSGRLLAFTVSALALVALTIPSPKLAQTYGNIFFASLLLFIGLALELRNLESTAAASDAPRV